MPARRTSSIRRATRRARSGCISAPAGPRLRLLRAKYFNGDLDEVALYGGLLTPARIDLPVTDLVREDATGDLYSASDFGVLVRLPAGSTSWGPAGDDLPNVEVAGLTIVQDEHELYAATHGLSAWMLGLE